MALSSSAEHTLLRDAWQKVITRSLAGPSVEMRISLSPHSCLPKDVVALEGRTMECLPKYWKYLYAWSLRKNSSLILSYWDLSSIILGAHYIFTSFFRWIFCVRESKNAMKYLISNFLFHFGTILSQYSNISLTSFLDLRETEINTKHGSEEANQGTLRKWEWGPSLSLPWNRQHTTSC